MVHNNILHNPFFRILAIATPKPPSQNTLPPYWACAMSAFE